MRFVCPIHGDVPQDEVQLVRTGLFRERWDVNEDGEASEMADDTWMKLEEEYLEHMSCFMYVDTPEEEEDESETQD